MDEKHTLIKAFQEKYPTKEAKEEALKQMPDEEIDRLINDTSNIYAKNFYSKFKKNK